MWNVQRTTINSSNNNNNNVPGNCHDKERLTQEIQRKRSTPGEDYLNSTLCSKLN